MAETGIQSAKKEEYEALSAKIADLERKNSDFLERMSIMEADSSRMRERLEKQSAEKTSIQRNYEELLSKIVDMQEQLDKSKRIIVDLRQRDSESAKKLSELSGKLSQSDESIKKLADAHTSDTSTISEYSSIINQIISIFPQIGQSNISGLPHAIKNAIAKPKTSQVGTQMISQVDQKTEQTMQESIESLATGSEDGIPNSPQRIARAARPPEDVDSSEMPSECSLDAIIQMHNKLWREESERAASSLGRRRA